MAGKQPTLAEPWGGSGWAASSEGLPLVGLLGPARDVVEGLVSDSMSSVEELACPTLPACVLIIGLCPVSVAALDS